MPDSTSFSGSLVRPGAEPLATCGWAAILPSPAWGMVRLWRNIPIIASVSSFDRLPENRLHGRFLMILPRIQQHARIFYRQVLCPGKKADFISEVIAICWKWFLRLEERKKDVTAFVSVFANLACRAVKSGRRLCGQECAKDALSGVAQLRHSFVVGKLPDYSTLNGTPIEEALRDNTRSEVPDQVCFRIDFPAWLHTRTQRDRRMIADMATGERTQHLAQKYRLSPARVSQLRRQYSEDWTQFCGDRT